MKKQLITLAIAAALAAPALAQSPGRTTTDAGGFAAIDRNGDGYISRDEARDATWNSRFSELDKDNDGRLTQEEFGALGSAAGATVDKDARSPSTTGGMGGSVGPGGTQSGSSTSGVGDKPGQKQ